MRGLFLVLALAACVPYVSAPGVTEDECGASDLQGLVGQPLSVVDGMRLSRSVRVIPEGGAVTMDFSPGRLNIQLDGADRITRVFCG